MGIPQDSRLRVTAYDRLQGTLNASIFVGGFLFATLFAIWWSHEFVERPGDPDFGPSKPIPLTNVSLDEEDLMLLEFSPAAAPPLSRDVEAVVDIVSTIMASEDKSLVDGLENSEGTRELGPIGLGGGFGKKQFRGTIPEPQRWSVIYKNPDFADYVQMLKFLDIEIGVVRLGKSQEIIRVQNGNDGFEAVQSDRAKEKASYHFRNTNATARRWDAQIAINEDVELGNSALVHFYSSETLERLRTAESNRVVEDGKTVEDILTTEFAIVPLNRGFEFRVQEISYR